jgi:hypothetical protein
LKQLFRAAGPLVIGANALLLLGALVSPAAAPPDTKDIAQLAVGEQLRDPSGEASLEFLQKGVSTPTDEGWTLARSVGCGFTVRVVGPYNEFKTIAPTTDGSILTTYAVGTQTLEGCKLLVMCLVREDDGLPADFASATADGLTNNEAAARRVDLTYRGYPTTRIRIERAGALYGAQLLRVGNVAYQQSVECPVSERDYFDSLEQVFFDSLEPGETGPSS